MTELRQERVRLPGWARPLPWLPWGMSTAVVAVYAVRIPLDMKDGKWQAIAMTLIAFVLIPQSAVAAIKLDKDTKIVHRIPLEGRLILICIHALYAWAITQRFSESGDSRPIVHGTAVGVMSAMGTLILATIINRGAHPLRNSLLLTPEKQPSDSWLITPQAVEHTILRYWTVSLCSAVPAAGLVVLNHYIFAAILGVLSVGAGLIRMTFTGWHDGYEDAHEGLASELGDKPRNTVRAWHAMVEKLTPSGKGLGYIYVIKFDTGAVKVGQTRRPYKRMSEHSRDCRPFGVNIEDVWVSRAHGSYLRSEKLLIAECQKLSDPVRKEYFLGVDYARVVEIACSLEMDGAARLTAEDVGSTP